jgi:hypothetical protein
MKVWQIPKHDEMPSEEMIAWLHEMKQEWDGDESGISIAPPLGPNDEIGEAKLGGPGDYIVESEGIYYVVTAAEFAEGNSLLNQLGYQP